MLSPADGKVMSVERARDPYLERDALKISVFMNVFNVHSNRSPVDGVVRKRWYHAGSFVNAALDKASLENERNALHIATATGVDVTCVQIAGLIARRILCYVEPGDTLRRGQRYGFIRFGSRVDVYLPADRHAPGRRRRRGPRDDDGARRACLTRTTAHRGDRADLRGWTPTASLSAWGIFSRNVH